VEGGAKRLNAPGERTTLGAQPGVAEYSANHKKVCYNARHEFDEMRGCG
jgi:hypothetical protein